MLACRQGRPVYVYVQLLDYSCVLHLHTVTCMVQQAQFDVELSNGGHACQGQC